MRTACSFNVDSSRLYNYLYVVDIYRQLVTLMVTDCLTWGMFCYELSRKISYNLLITMVNIKLARALYYLVS